ncbi:MAG TPA: hypothetical protein VLG15_04185 [Thermoanaerobaculia bacterium]|nr:hypothetical protein [Thermoanaerobaculia bacterium]
MKVLDARSFNGRFWVFFGALSNVEYSLNVTDTETGSTKTYENPSGRFASVGDTAAFTGSAAGGISTHETVEADGTPTPPGSLAAIQRFLEAAETKSASRGSAGNAAFTPCPGTPRILSLSNCRFQLQVEWTDPQGRRGSGQAVQLTNDTGYFWFFSDNNVELIVKVLDARAFNGHFWVFYGALSNVQYSILLVDSVAGSYKTYVNPSGTFASVGDTSALRGGSSVAPVLDTTHAGSANLDEKGGSVTTTGADGTVFTLEVPPEALVRPETVTLTPVSRMDRFPFSGGLVAGVEIEPNGVDLLVPAILTIRPTSSPPVNRMLPYAYRRGGEDFILYLRDLDTSSLRLPLVTLAGYGVGQGDPSEAASQADKLSSGPLAGYLQRYAREVFLRVLGQISEAELHDRLIGIYREALAEVVARLLRPAEDSGLVTADVRDVMCPLDGDEFQKQVERKALQEFFGLERQKQLAPGLFGYEDGDQTAAHEYAKAILRKCMEGAFDRCVSRNDPHEVLLMLDIMRELQRLGEEDPLLTTFMEGSFAERCLRFELDFESTLKSVQAITTAGRTLTTTIRQKYRAPHVPLRFSYARSGNVNQAVWKGACSLLPQAAEIELPADVAGAGCTVRINPGSSRFNAFAAWIGIVPNPTQSAMKLLYDPGSPTVNATLTCEDATVPFPVFSFDAYYETFHANEHLSPGYLASDWEPLPYGEFFARKSYERSTTLGQETRTEETWFFLKHTPDAPMPDCP